MGMRNLTPPHH
nr:unnamed protein product [Callosobruchus analis]